MSRTSSVSYDVVIIGAGPAGASVARAVSGHGQNCIILEKTKLPRYKMCSGILGTTSMQFVADNFGPMPKEVVSTPFDVIGFKAHKVIGQQPLALPFSVLDPGPGERIGCSVKRPEFDHWLSKESGAELRDECIFVGLEVEDDVIRVGFECKGQRSYITAKYVVGADGPISKVRSSVNPEFDKNLRLIPNYEEWYEGEVDLEPNWLHCFYDAKLTSYFATLFHKDGKIIVVTGSKNPEPTRKYFLELVDYLKKSHGLVIKRKAASYGCVLHDMSATNNFYLGAGNVLLTGEAGGFNRCAEGISSALITGKAAGEAILKSVESGVPAITYYCEGAAPEANVCTNASAVVAEVLGYNPFTR